jgi:hypothetical protein
MTKLKIGNLGSPLVASWDWALTTYFGKTGFLRMKAKPSGRSVATPEGQFQLAGRVHAVDATGDPDVVQPSLVDAEGRVTVQVGDDIYVWMTLWMTNRCHIYVVTYPDGAIVVQVAADRERDAFQLAVEQMKARDLL